VQALSIIRFKVKTQQLIKRQTLNLVAKVTSFKGSDLYRRIRANNLYLSGLDVSFMGRCGGALHHSQLGLDW